MCMLRTKQHKKILYYINLGKWTERYILLLRLTSVTASHHVARSTEYVARHTIRYINKKVHSTTRHLYDVWLKGPNSSNSSATAAVPDQSLWRAREDKAAAPARWLHLRPLPRKLLFEIKRYIGSGYC